jgi:hypothetical protein
MDNIKQSDIKYFLKNADKKQKEKFNLLYKRVTKYKKQYGGNETITILWVRHCQSCANVAPDDLTNKQRFYRQPLCTAEGRRQCISFGERLRKWLLKSKYKDIHFFSSWLPRAALTAKFISAGFDPQTVPPQSPQSPQTLPINIPRNILKGLSTAPFQHTVPSQHTAPSQHTMAESYVGTSLHPPISFSTDTTVRMRHPSISKEITPLEHISEITNLINKAKSIFHSQSQSQTRKEDLLNYINKINSTFPFPVYGYDISIANMPLQVKYTSNDWVKFKSTLSSSKFDRHGVNLIVSHGQYLRKHVLPEVEILMGYNHKVRAKGNTQNLEAWLITYKKIDLSREWEAIEYQFVSDLNHPVFADPTFMHRIKGPLTNCDYKYDRDIRPPTPEEKKEKKRIKNKYKKAANAANARASAANARAKKKRQIELGISNEELALLG